MGRKECCIWDLVGSACVEAEIGGNLMFLLLLLFHVLHVLLTASMLSHPWWQDSTICGALFATEIYIHSPWLKRWKRYIGLTLEHTLIHCILYYFLTHSQTSNGVFTTPIIDEMKGNVTFHWAHENKYTLLFFYISIHHIQHIYSSVLFLLEVNDRVAMRPPAEPIIGTRLFLNLPSPTFAALFPAPNVFVSFDLINHCWLILTKGLLSCVVAAEVDNQWNPTETQDQSRWHKTRDREGEGGTSTIKEKRGLLHHKTRWGGGDFKCTIQRGVDDHIYARCCNNTLLQFDHLRLVGKILNSLECLWHKILAPPPSCGSFNFLIHFSFL